MLNIVYSKIVAVLVFFSVFVFLFSTPTEVKAESSLSKIYTTYIIEPGVFAIETLSEMFSILTGGNVNLLANTSSATSSSNIFTDYIIDPLGEIFYNIFDFSLDVVEPNLNTVPKVTTTTVPPVISEPIPTPTETTTTTPVTNQYFNTYTTPAVSTSTGERGPQGPQGPTGPRGPAGADADTSNFVSNNFFDNQVNGILTSIEDGISGISSSLGEQVQTALLSVSGGSDLSGAVVIGSALSGTDKALTVNNNTSTGNIFEAQDGGSAVFTIADGGNVGVGNTSPGAKLVVGPSPGSLKSGWTSASVIANISPSAANRSSVLVLEGNQNANFVGAVLALRSNPSVNFANDVATSVGQYLGAISFEGFSTTTGLSRFGSYITSKAESVQDTSLSADLQFHVTNSSGSDLQALTILSSGLVGIGTTTPTAVLHLKSGTATASTAPLKFTSGTLLTTPEAGAVEFLTDAYYGTITTGGARRTFAFLESPTFTGTVTIPTPFTLGATSVTSTGTQFNYLNAATGTTGTTSTNLVFSTSPTLVTPILGTPQSVTLTNATGLPASAVLAGTFGTGAYVMDTSLTVPAINGSTAANGDITINGTTSATKDTSYVILQETGGNVGVGITVPTASLEIQKNTATTTDNALKLSNTTAVGGTALAMYNRVSIFDVPSLRIFSSFTDGTTYASGRTIFSTIDASGGSVDALTLDTPNTGGGYGNVGINVTTPEAVLEVRGSATDLAALTLSNAGNAADDRTTLLFKSSAYGIGAALKFRLLSGATASNLEFYTTSGSVLGQKAVILNTGNFGIMTTSPDKALEINSATGANLRLTYNDSDGSATNYSDFTVGSTGGLTLTAAGTNPKTLVVNNGSSAGNIFEAQDDGTAVFTVADGGAVNSGNITIGTGNNSMTIGLGSYAGMSVGSDRQYSVIGMGNVATLFMDQTLTTGHGSWTPTGLRVGGTSGFASTKFEVGDATSGRMFSVTTAGATNVGGPTVTGSTVPLTVNNGDSTGNIFEAQDGGTAVVTIADGGNVGVGVAAPQAILDLQATGGLSSSVIRLRQQGFPTYGFDIGIDNLSNGRIAFSSNNGGVLSENFSIDRSSGVSAFQTSQVTTGSTPSYILKINRQNSSTESFYLGTDPSANAVISTNNVGLRIGTGGAGGASYLESIRILQSNGFVGIGTTAPDKAFEINSATGANMRLTYNDADGSAANYSDFTIGSTGGLTLTAAGTNPKTLVVNNGTSTGNIFEAQDNGTAVFTVADGGNVGIGTTNPGNKLTVANAELKTSLARVKTLGLRTSEDTGFGVDFIITGGADDSVRLVEIQTGQNNTSNGGMLALQGQGGIVGIGTDAPSRTLEINSNSGENLRLTYGDDNGNPTNYADLSTSSSGDLTIAPSGGDTNFTGNTSITSTNSTGVTTASALALNANSLTTGTGGYLASSTLTSGKLLDLQVSGTAAAASQTALNILTAGANATNAITTYGAQISNTHTNATSGTNIGLYLNASGATTANYGLIVDGGNVGIGTATPETKLVIVDTKDSSSTAQLQNLSSGTSAIGTWQLVNDTGAQFAMNFFGSNYSTGGLAGYGRLRTSSGATGMIIGTGGAGDPLILRTADANRIWIDGGGSVGVGDDTPDALFDVKGTVCLDINADDVCTDDTSALSDSRLKDNVTDIENGLELVREFRPVNFTWNGTNNTGNSNSLGFIAQDMEAIFPNLDLVITDTSGYKHLDYSKLTAVLTDAIQELDINLEAISGNIIPESESFATDFFENLFSKVTAWLADASNGIGDLFADSVYTKELCVTKSDGEDFCVTGDQLEALVGSGGGSSGSGSSGGDEPALEEPAPTSAEGEPTPEEVTPVDGQGGTGEVIPITEEAPTGEEPISAPEEIPASEPAPDAI